MRIVIVFSFFMFSSLFGGGLKVNVSAKSAILINAETGEILYNKKGDERAYPASITKIATCLYAVKTYEGSLSDLVTCPQQYLRKMNKSVKVAHSYKDPSYLLEPDGLTYWIKRGEKLTVEDLIYGNMLVSGNDASNALAQHIGGTIPKFMEGMNAFLKELGCQDTQFTNPHGLHHPTHWTTAHDMALIAQEALKDELIQKVIRTKEYEREETNLQTAKKIKNRNLLIQPGKFFYPRALGMKTGYHSDANYTYVSAAKDGDRSLIVVLMGCDELRKCFRDAIRLFETAFEEEEEERLLFNREENVFSRSLSGGKTPLKASLTEDIFIKYYPSEEPQLTIELSWEHLEAPIKRGAAVGTLNVLSSNQEVLASAPLVAVGDVDRSLGALIGGALRGDVECPKEFQKILTLFLALGVIAVLYGLRLAKDEKNP